MLKRKWVAAKLFAVLGGAGLAFSLCVPRASAQDPPPFSNANYLNRYTCNESEGGNAFTGQAFLHSNGSGTFVSGTLEAPISADGGVFVASNPPTLNFCGFTLDISGSSYLVGADGIGVEVLSWTPNATNNPACAAVAGDPYFPAVTFLTSDTFVMRLNGIKPSGAVVRTEVTSNNFLNKGTLASDHGGYGHCLK